MIGTRIALGNLPLRRAVRTAVPLLCAVLLGGCADVFFATVGAVGPARGVVRQTGIEFDPADGLSLDAYAPKAAVGAPVIVFLYGGSWEEGKRRWYRYVGDALASNGVAVVIPDYRKFPQVRFPAFVVDAARAVAWARAHARDFGGDSSRLFVMGHSAGGQIAALLSTDPRYLAAVGLSPRDLAGMIGLAGAYAFLPFVDDEAQIFGDDARGRHDSQPVNFVDGDEPPLLLLQGEADDEVAPDNATTLAARARAAGDTVTLKLYPDVGHASILLALARGHVSHVPTLRDVLDFVTRTPAAPAARGE